MLLKSRSLVAFFLRSCLGCLQVLCEISKVASLLMPPGVRGLFCRWKIWGICYAFSWTYAFLSSLSADQSLGY